MCIYMCFHIFTHIFTNLYTRTNTQEPDDGFSLSVCINQVPEEATIEEIQVCLRVYVCVYVCVCVCVFERERE